MYLSCSPLSLCLSLFRSSHHEVVCWHGSHDLAHFAFHYLNGCRASQARRRTFPTTSPPPYSQRSYPRAGAHTSNTIPCSLSLRSSDSSHPHLSLGYPTPAPSSALSCLLLLSLSRHTSSCSHALLVVQLSPVVTLAARAQLRLHPQQCFSGLAAPFHACRISCPYRYVTVSFTCTRFFGAQITPRSNRSNATDRKKSGIPLPLLWRAILRLSLPPPSLFVIYSLSFPF